MGEVMPGIEAARRNVRVEVQRRAEIPEIRVAKEPHITGYAAGNECLEKRAGDREAVRKRGDKLWR